MPTGSTNRLGTPMACWITLASARPLRMPERPALLSTPNTWCWRGPRRSASTSSVRPPSCARVTARLAAKKVLPSPASGLTIAMAQGVCVLLTVEERQLPGGFRRGDVLEHPTLGVLRLVSDQELRVLELQAILERQGVAEIDRSLDGTERLLRAQAHELRALDRPGRAAFPVAPLHRPPRVHRVLLRGGERPAFQDGEQAPAAFPIQAGQPAASRRHRASSRAGLPSAR